MLIEINTEILPLNRKSMIESKKRWDSIAKPLNGLGDFENFIIQIAGITNSPNINLDKKAVVVFCADNGVTVENITQTSNEVTAIVTENMSKGLTSVCNMAKIANTKVIPVDMGVARNVEGENILRYKIAYGTKNIAQSPAMTGQDVLNGINYAVDLVGDLKKQGFKILATGEMGIGNTTTSSAISSVLLGLDVGLVTGRGAGLSDEGLKRKIDVIKRAIEINSPDPNDPIDVLSKLGGFDLVGLTGLFLGGGIHRLPIVVDGFISATAALIAKRICPDVRDYLIASHVSKEPAAISILDELNLKACINSKMCLGEGSGAIMMFPLLDMALSVYNNMPTFNDISIDDYKPLEELNK